MLYDRNSNRIIADEQFGSNALNMLYNNKFGRLLLHSVIIKPWISELNGIINNTNKSTEKIKPFIEKYNIKMEDFEEEDYHSFGDFFVRKIKPAARPIDMGRNALISPADSKITAYSITADLSLNIKGTEYKLCDLVRSSKLSEAFRGGICYLLRLSVDDYHRYHYFDDGMLLLSKNIKGKLHTVSSFSNGYKIYSENHRIVNLLKTRRFGYCVQIEVGALLVGKIINHPIKKFRLGTEKGYFKYGGSSIILLFKKGSVIPDYDIMKYSQRGVETKVKMGERIGIFIND